MSAFIVSSETMHRVIAAIDAEMHQEGIFGSDAERAQPGYLVRTTGDLEKLGAALWAMNTEAVNYRYREHEDAIPYRYRPIGPITDPEAYMALSCLLYQCAEGDVPECGLYKALDSLRDRIANRIAHGLANARKVPWDWPERVTA